MKALVVCVGSPGHLNPLLPLMKALMASGDQVTVATAPDVATLVANTGAEFFPAGHGEGVWFGQLQARIRGIPGDGLAPERINHYFLPRLFGEIAADDMIDDVVSCGERLRPDLVLFETYALAGPLAANCLGVPAVHHLLGPMFGDGALELADDAVSPLWSSFGRRPGGYAGVYRDITIGICPPSLETLRAPTGEQLTLRPVPLPMPATTAPARPLVYVTLGTFFNSNLEVFRAVLDGLGSEPVEVVLTVGDTQDPAALAPVPANARVERFIPQASLLPSCSVVVHHGGAGTMFGSLGHGLPQVVIPQGADNFMNADTLERSGVATVLRPGEVTAQGVTAAVNAVLHDPSYARAAQAIAAEIAAMPDEADVADALHAFVRARRAARS